MAHVALQERSVAPRPRPPARRRRAAVMATSLLRPVAPRLQCAFTTSACARLAKAPRHPPESPKYIEVPQPSLPRSFPHPRPKGILPKPKNLFPASGPDKTSGEFLQKVTPEPTAPPQPAKNPDVRAYQEWKAAMADKRRKNLRHSLLEMATTKQEADLVRVEKLERRNRRREQKLNEAMASDVRLTLPSVLVPMNERGPLQDPNRRQRLAEMHERVKKFEEQKRERRGAEIYQLYLNADNFLLTEAQLDAEIERTFQENDSLRQELPRNVADMLAERRGLQAQATYGDSKTLALDVAGALTGGPLRVESIAADSMYSLGD